MNLFFGNLERGYAEWEAGTKLGGLHGQDLNLK